MIAMALACNPSLLIADEPTTALDVTIQAQIVELVKDLQQKLGMAIIWISHNLALVAGMVDKVIVMYSGYIVEQAPVDDLYERPLHPYTLGLLHAIPTAGPAQPGAAGLHRGHAAGSAQASGWLSLCPASALMRSSSCLQAVPSCTPTGPSAPPPAGAAKSCATSRPLENTL